MIAIASDHAAVKEKQKLIDHLRAKGMEVRDFGANSEAVRVDYPDYAEMVANAINKGECEQGILLCGTGIGMSIAANKIRGIRCAHCTDTYSAKMAKQHNNANIIALGAAITGASLMQEIVDAYLATPFSHEERHCARINKIKALEK